MPFLKGSGLYDFLVNSQVLNNEVLAVGSVLAHIELKHFSDAQIFSEDHRVEAYAFPDKVNELIR